MKKISLLAAAVSMALTGCGSDDSSSPSSGTSPQMGGIVITSMDGYLKNALVCSDQNLDGECNPGEEITTHDGALLLTNEHGQLNLEGKITQEQQRNIESYPVVVKVLQPYEDNTHFHVESGIYTVDMDHQFQPMDKNIVFRTPVGQTVANPFTDLVVAEMNKGKTQQEAEADVATTLISLNGSTESIDLYADYVEIKQDSNATAEEQQLAAEMHKTAQVLTETKSNADTAEQYDDVALEITEQAVVTVNNASDSEIQDPDFKPTIPLTEKDGKTIVEPPVTNYQAKVDGDTANALNDELSDLSLTTVRAFEHSLNTTVDTLFSDKDQQGGTLSVDIENANALQEQNILVSINNGTLTLKSANDVEGRSKVTNGEYIIVLVSDDIDSNGEIVGQVKAAISLTVEPLDTRPDTDHATMLYIQNEVLDSLSLTKSVEMVPEVIDISTLFYDEDGDELAITAETTLAGVTASVSEDSTTVTLAGTPEVDGDGFKLYITVVDENNNKLQAQFRLPEVQQPAPPVNNAPTVDYTRQAQVQTEVNKLPLQQAEVSDEQIDIQNLFVDQDNDALVITANTDVSGLTASIEGDTVHLVGTPTQAGTGFKLFLEASDGESDITTELELPEILPMAWTPIEPPSNTAPVVNTEEKAKLQGQVNNLYLEQGIALDETAIFSLSDLFTDAEHDKLTYQATTSLSGLDVSVQEGDLLFISGTPSQSGTGYQINITSSDGSLSGDVTINLPEVEEAFVPTPANTLASLLMQEPSYRYEQYTVNGVASVYCYGSQLKPDGTFYEAELLGNHCPSSDNFVEAGTWEASDEDVLMTRHGMTVQLTLNQDETQNVLLPRLHLFAKEATSTIVKAKNQEGYALTNVATSEPVTFLYGEEAATDYWASNFTYGYSNGELAHVSAISKSHLSWSRDPIDCTSGTCEEDVEPMDLDVVFDQSCQDIGFEWSMSAGAYIDKDYRYSFSLIHDKFESGKYTLNTYSAYPTADGCSVDFDFGENESFPEFIAADNIAFVAQSTDANFEDVVISTFVDRELTVQPQHSLSLSAQSIYFIEFDKGYMHKEEIEQDQAISTDITLNELVATDNELSIVESYYEAMELGPNKGDFYWYPIEYTDVADLFVYTAHNDKQLYQVWTYDTDFNPLDPANPIKEGDDSYTLWLDAQEQISIVHAGQLNPLTTSSSYPTFDNKQAAQQYVEDLFAQEISFVGTTWMSTENGEAVTYTYSENGARIEYNGEVEELTWEEYPADLPCLVSGDHTCNFAEMNAYYEWDDEHSNGMVTSHVIEWTWNTEVDANVFYRIKDGRDEEAMTRVID
ncbi:hypothetical protein AB4182_09015 [Vibrio splendidus]